MVIGRDNFADTDILVAVSCPRIFLQDFQLGGQHRACMNTVHAALSHTLQKLPVHLPFLPGLEPCPARLGTMLQLAQAVVLCYN